MAMVILELLIVLVYSSFIYVPLSSPGYILCVFLRGYLRTSFWQRASAISFAMASFLEPVFVVIGVAHGIPFLIPIPFAFLYWRYTNQGEMIWGAMISFLIVLIASLAVALRYGRRESLNLPISGRIDNWWRGELG
jgi:hypothetical protein